MAKALTPLIFTQRAEKDLLEIYSFLSAHAPQALEKVGLKVSKALDQMRHFPESGTFVKDFKSKRYREKVVFHYRIIYKYLKEERRIQILTVRHGKRFLPEILC